MDNHSVIDADLIPLVWLFTCLGYLQINMRKLISLGALDRAEYNTTRSGGHK